MIKPYLLFRKNKTVKAGSEERSKHFLVRREKNSHGFYVFVLENRLEQRKILIPRFVFGRFRACLKKLLVEELAKPAAEAFERRVGFLKKDYFYFKSSHMDLQNLIIQDLDEPEGSSGYITVSRRDAKALSEVLYSEALQHPSDVLSAIVSYHKLFQFSFVKTSKSITSDLILRKDVLQEITDYKPTLAARAQESKPKLSESQQRMRSDAAHFAKSQSPLKKANYQPRLGERFHEKEIKVDYGQLFSDPKVKLDLNSKAEAKDSSKAENDSLLTQFPTSLSAKEVKAFGDGKFRLELGADEASVFRDRFICDRSGEFYLGFEIVDTLFVQRKTLKSLRFPLYYLKVSVRESGREVRLQAKEDGRIYLNHLALANVINKFGKSKTEMEGLAEFFDTLLAQHLNIDQVSDRIYLSRHLPVTDSVFDRTREVLFGYKGENGKGGILGGLSFKGIECDLNGVIMYRAPSLLSPVEQALERDVDDISTIAHQSVKRFYASLLGRFLTPELALFDQQESLDDKPTWMPGRLSKSTQQLVKKLNYHDIVLLEGPPGTGKTYTIRNLLIDHICQGKRVLIVSDQKAAIEALIEKVQSYLYRNDKSTVEKGVKDSLLFSALNVIDTVPDNTDNLSELLEKLSDAFKVTEQLNSEHRKTLDRRLHEIDSLIKKCSREIGQYLKVHMDESVPYQQRLPHKLSKQLSGTAIASFLKIVAGGEKRGREVVRQFIEHRLALTASGMQACYNYFKLPNIELEKAIHRLEEDLVFLRSLQGRLPNSLAEFATQIQHTPHHELLIYLQSCFVEVEDSELQQRGAGLSGLFTSKQNHPMKSSLELLLAAMGNQMELLRSMQEWPGELREVLNSIHETIRVGDKPDLALSIFQRNFKSERLASASTSQSIHYNLEKIEDLFAQRDELVYERFVASLQAICSQALLNKQRSGTNAITKIMSLLENLQQFKSVQESGDVFLELRESLLQTFPVWILRKQLVPLLLPCEEKSFDLVIVDEATQCRVDDALSLMFRAKKVLVVGDDKQTVLQKDSVVDDYLFKDHDLDEHLRSTQARGFKGGGSNIFALIKSIKQAEVMLDEHYRCPAEIIAFSNRYVYENKLKVMQWKLPDQAKGVVVDDSEKKQQPGKKPTSGKFKGIETLMVDRFLEYVGKSIRKIEKARGERINLETDVALCYFLLKNEPYVSQALGEFLSKMNRGEHVLHGAGAALQGKERDYIFYFWDITRYNLAAFAQGDEEDKRRGELNVLMSRPKKMAYHYLHHAFHSLNHRKSNIASYLLKALNSGKSSAVNNISGENNLFYQVLELTLNRSSQRGFVNLQNKFENGVFNFCENVVVGNTLKKVDLVIFPEGKVNSSIGLIDLSYFNATDKPEEEVLDYYFQLKRAQPKIDPVFIFSHELADENSFAFQSLVNKLSH